MTFSDIISLPFFDSVANVMDSPRLLTFICSILFPFLSAVCIFICLHAATARRKLFCFFLGMIIYIIPTAFLLTDIEGTARTLAGSSDIPAIPDALGFLSAAALGIAYLGITSLICSDGVTKSSGRLFIFFSTVICFSLTIVICYYSLLALTDNEAEATLVTVFPGIETFGPAALFSDLSINFAPVPLLSLFLILLFTSFMFDKNRDELRREDIERLHEIEAEASRIEKEGVCAVCRYAALPETGRGNVFCERKGSMPPDARCSRFEYDPLKRIPEKHGSAHGTETRENESNEERAVSADE